MYGQPGKPCPVCGPVPMQRGVLVKCCGAKGCTWLRCRKCGGFGHPTGRWLKRNPELARDPVECETEETT